MLDKNSNITTSNHSQEHPRPAEEPLLYQFEGTSLPPLPREIYLGRKRKEQPPVAEDDLRPTKKAKL